MTWLLIDGNNWYARDFYASPELAATHFTRRLADLRAQVDHSRVAVCWDARSCFRHQLLDSYKASRAEKPTGFYSQMNDLRNELAVMADVTSFHIEGFEADDLLAALTRNALDEGEKAVIFSGDRDLYQCLQAGNVSQVLSVTRLKPGKLSFATMTADKLMLDFGVQPWQWIDYRLIVGDSSDNLLGCKGVGPAAAREILQKCDSLERFFTNPFSANISNSQRSKLLAWRPQVELLRRIVTLAESAPLPAVWLQGVSL